MANFDRVMVVDWSAAATPSPKRPKKDAIWIAETGGEGGKHWYVRTRELAMQLVRQRIQAALDANIRLLIGFDFPFGYPAGFAGHLTGSADAFAVWAMLAGLIEDAKNNTSNRFGVANTLNQRFSGVGPFWGCPASQPHAHLPAKGSKRTPDHGMTERRYVEQLVPRAQSCWKLFTTGSVGSQSLLGIARLEALRRQFPDVIAVWPFEVLEKPVTLAEIYPSLLDPLVRRVDGVIKDAVQVRLLAHALQELDQAGQMTAALSAATGEGLREEGWILGVGSETALSDAAERVFDTIDFQAAPIVLENTT